MKNKINKNLSYLIARALEESALGNSIDVHGLLLSIRSEHELIIKYDKQLDECINEAAKNSLDSMNKKLIEELIKNPPKEMFKL